MTQKEIQKRYYENHKAERLAYQRNYSLTHSEKVKADTLKNKDRQKGYTKKYQKTHPEKISKYQHDYYLGHKEKFSRYYKAYNKTKRKCFYIETLTIPELQCLLPSPFEKIINARIEFLLKNK